MQLKVCFGVFILQAGFNMGPMGMGNMDFSQMLNNPALMNMVITFIQHKTPSRTSNISIIKKIQQLLSIVCDLKNFHGQMSFKIRNCVLIFLYFNYFRPSQ